MKAATPLFPIERLPIMADIIDYSTVEEVVEVVKAERASADYGKNRIVLIRDHRTQVVRNGVKLHLPSCTVIIGDTHHRLVRQIGSNSSDTGPLTLIHALQKLLPSLQKVGHIYNGTRVAPTEYPLYEGENGLDRADFVDFNTVKTIKKH